MLSIDIDGNDFHVARALLEDDWKPALFVVEYNASFGPEQALTVPYDEGFVRHDRHSSGLYHGASIMAFRRLFGRFNYRFLTVDSHGVNAFFVDPSRFDSDFLGRLRGCDYLNNFARQTPTRKGWQASFDIIKDLPFVEVE
ncbi:MAG: hypothetical protein KGR26_12380 [Cyanobacteria bacterium REEB65]|nr:hypothetical protein [Cyanobacteria bacterium REEB65]